MRPKYEAMKIHHAAIPAVDPALQCGNERLIH